MSASDKAIRLFTSLSFIDKPQVRHFASGQITNDEFIRRCLSSKTGPVIWGLDDTVWCLYDDVATHKLTGKYALWSSWIFGFGQRRLKKFMSSGDYEVWPFPKREGLERARREPVLLTGNV